MQCRTVEVFESFGIEEGLLREGYWVNEVAFWDVVDLDSKNGAGGRGATNGTTTNGAGEEDGGGGAAKHRRGLARTNRTPDTEPGLSHLPHVILNQARVNGLMLEKMQRENGQDVEYGWEVKDVRVDESVGPEDREAYPVTVTAVKDGVEHTFQAQYVLGCDGAHSVVRRSLGYKMLGDSSDSVWGVLDVYPRTDFPDIRKKATLHSDAGNMLIIPREGDDLVRFYIQLPVGTVAKEVKLEELHEASRKIFSQYHLEIAGTHWWSAYSVGQRLADHFHKNNRVFLFGDACHTHSPKAGQGMNVSLQDGYNFGWKLAALFKGQAGPEILETYTLERGKTAKDLIDFDKEWSKLFGQKASAEFSKKFSEAFIKSGRYTAGLTATYLDSILTTTDRSEQHRAANVKVGMRFPSAQVIRVCDTKAMQLVRALPADGRWRIVIFPGDAQNRDAMQRLQRLASYLDSSEGPIHKFTLPDADPDSLIETVVVMHSDRTKFEQEQLPLCFSPVSGKYKMRDIKKVFVDDHHTNYGHGRAYEKYGIDVDQGAMIVVRPDHYVSLVTEVGNHTLLGSFFGAFFKEAR